MSSLCWSLPHLLTSHLPQHEAPPGQHDLLRGDTVHQEPLPPLPKTAPGRNAALKNHSLTSFMKVPETCAQTLPQVMSPKCLRPESNDVHRELGVQDQQPPGIEKVKEFGQIQTRSLLDHEMAEMSLVEKMSYLQSQMHFDLSMESIADSDLEDGELQKLLSSPLYAQRAFGKPDAMVVQEREVSAQRSHSSEGHGASGCIVFTKT